MMTKKKKMEEEEDDDERQRRRRRKRKGEDNENGKLGFFFDDLFIRLFEATAASGDGADKKARGPAELSRDRLVEGPSVDAVAIAAIVDVASAAASSASAAASDTAADVVRAAVAAAEHRDDGRARPSCCRVRSNVVARRRERHGRPDEFGRDPPPRGPDVLCDLQPQGHPADVFREVRGPLVLSVLWGERVERPVYAKQRPRVEVVHDGLPDPALPVAPEDEGADDAGAVERDAVELAGDEVSGEDVVRSVASRARGHAVEEAQDLEGCGAGGAVASGVGGERRGPVLFFFFFQ